MSDRKRFLLLLVPALLETLSITLLSVVATAVVSTVGEYAMSAVAIVNTIGVVLMNAFIAIGTGVTVKIAQYMGQNRANDARTAGEQGILFAVLFAGVLAALLLVFSREILTFLFGAAEARILDAARVYLLCTAVSSPFYALYTTSVGVLRGVGDFKYILFFALAINVLYAAFCMVFVLVFGLGVLGAGLALIAARVLCGVGIYRFVRRGTDKIRINSFFRRPTRAVILPVLRIGIPSAIEEFSFNGGKLLVQSLLVTLGSVAVAGTAIIQSLEPFLILPGTAMNMVVMTVVGHSFGTGDLIATRKRMWKLIGCASLLMFALNAVCAFLVEPMVALYHPTPETASLARGLTWLIIVVYPFFWPLTFVAPATLRAVGDVKFTTTVSVASCLILRVGGSYLLVTRFGMGVEALWYAMFADWACRIVCFLTRIASHRWERPDRI